MLNLEQETPDDGQRSCPKHVELYDRINLDKYCVWLVIKKRINLVGYLARIKYKTYSCRTLDSRPKEEDYYENINAMRQFC